MSHKGEVLSDRCKCGHLKNHHQPMPDGSIQCQEKVFSVEANKMLQCGCVIHKPKHIGQLSAAWI